MRYTKTIVICWVAAVMGVMAGQQANGATTSAEAAGEEHPFLSEALYPKWSKLTPEQGEIDVREAVERAKAKIEEIRRIKPEEANFENVFRAYEQASLGVEKAEGLMQLLEAVMDSESIRRAQEELIPELSLFSASITSDAQLWQVIKSAAAAPWVKELSPAKQRYVQQVVDAFHDSGADLNAQQKERLMQIIRELSTLSHQFDKNVLDSTNAWQWVVTDEAQLKGMSKQWMDRAAADAKAKGYGTDKKPAWLITLQEPSAREVLQKCDVEATRKKCWEALSTVGKEPPYDNEGIVARVMELRKEMATLLGFDSFADLTLARRMAGSGQRAMAFIDDMMVKVKPAFDAEIKELLDYVSREKKRKVEALEPWETSYYMRKLSRQRFDFDTELLRPYQECNNVINGMLSIYQGLYDITIVELPTYVANDGKDHEEGSVEVWMPEVRAFAVHDNRTGAHLGSFYMDLFPRESKRSGAWVQPLSYGDPAQDGKPHQPHLALLAANLSPAGADHPALFSHLDVETIFHEFGHMMHTMLGDTEMVSHCGSTVAWDFVELPSQLNENWTWEPKGIETYARHYKTGEPIPADMVEKLGKLRFFFPANEDMSQLCIAKLDMEMHMNYADKFWGKGLDAATYELLTPWRTPMSVQPPSIMRNLTHCISGGYAAGYYSYKWAEVLAADIFTRFEKEGILNPTVGAAYRNEILSRGDSAPPSELYRNFMGRDPNPDALLQKQGLKP